MNIRRFNFDIALLVEVNKCVNDFTEVVIIGVAKKEGKKKKEKEIRPNGSSYPGVCCICVCVYGVRVYFCLFIYKYIPVPCCIRRSFKFVN